MRRRILVLGGDGYLGWPCANYFIARGHEVAIIDNQARRGYDDELGTDSLLPIADFGLRISDLIPQSAIPNPQSSDVAGEYDRLARLIADFQPDAIIHFAEQRSAPYSMIDHEHCVYTHHNNVIGTLNVLYAMRDHAPDAHLIKLGTMGEYGTPNIDIEEGFIEIEHRGRRDVLPFPKQAGSWYHQTKVHDSNNIMFACKVWGLKATDLNQGVVYGAETDECPADSPMCTRYDYDHVFGTVLNRFCVQAALGMPLTVYGHGGQTRGYLDIRDTMRCIELAMDNPPGEDISQSSQSPPRKDQNNELSSRPLRALRETISPIPTYQVFNQITEVFSINDLARMVQQAAAAMGKDLSQSTQGESYDNESSLRPLRALRETTITHIPNPRVEAEKHYYNPDFSRFKVLGLQARRMVDAIPRLIELALKHKSRVRVDTIMPTVLWKRSEK